MISDRERFSAVLASQPLLRGDAIVVLCGEDAEARLNTGVGLLQHGAATTLVLSGGRHDPPAILSAEHCAPLALGRGVGPSALLIEGASQHTREQAANVVALAVANTWRRILVVASPYHIPRALLSFIQAATVAGVRETLHVVAVPGAELPWGKSPPGVALTRLALLDVEYRKARRYQDAGNIATWRNGLEYLSFWEGR